MNNMQIPPTSGGSPIPPSSSDNPLVDELVQLHDSYTKYMEQFLQGDHSKEAIQGLKDAAEKLEEFLEAHKEEIEEECKAKGWPSGGIGGYDSCLEGAKTCVAEIESGNINIADCQMLNEDTAGIVSMLTQHHG